MSTKAKKTKKAKAKPKRKSMLIQMDGPMFLKIQKEFGVVKKKKSGSYSRNAFLNDELQKHFGGNCKAAG